MPTTLTNGIQLPDKGSVDWYNSMQSNYNLIDTHLGDTDTHVTAEDKANWNSKQGSLSQAQLDAIAQVATNTSDIASLQSGKANASHTHSSSDITDIGDYATKQYVDNSISGLVDSAPNALDTLNELAAALNDDANFASTVATALSAKANSADLATVATSGSYNDLSNKPTINDSTITIQKNGSLVGTFTVNGSAKTIDIPVPAKTSDLTNDSNFVDTSNSAVASGITSSKVTSYDSHIADTDIHVTTADKTKWNNGVTQSYVFRYSSTALVASSTNSNALLDNTDNLKVGDKVIDSNGVLFSITAIDTQNSTFTIGTALVDLAQDSDVVHKSGDETIAGIKTFSNNIIRGLTTIASRTIKGGGNTPAVGSNGVGYLQNQAILTYQDSTPAKDVTVSLEVQDSNYTDGKSRAYFPNSNNVTNLGKSGKRWANVYATNYYYGGSEVEFSTKFVTTDTAQTVDGNKTFSSVISSDGSYLGNESSGNERTNLCLRSNRDTAGQSGAYIGRFRQNRAQGEMSGGEVSFITFDFLENSVRYTRCFTMGLTDWDSNGVPQTYYLTSPGGKGSLGTSSQKWATINGLEPSALSMPDIDNKIDISSYITNLSNVGNEYTPSVNGWICIRSGNATKISVLDVATSVGNASLINTPTYLTVMTPVVANRKVYITVICTSLEHAYFIPCQGNV